VIKLYSPISVNHCFLHGNVLGIPVIPTILLLRLNSVFLSTHADRQRVDISVTIVCFVFVRLRISPARIKLAASNFVRCFRGVLGKESPIFGELCSPRRPKSDESASHREVEFNKGNHTTNVTLQMRRSWNMSRRGCRSACVYIGQSPLT